MFQVPISQLPNTAGHFQGFSISMTVHVQTTQVPHGGAVPSTQTTEIKLTVCSLTLFFRILMILSGYIWRYKGKAPPHPNIWIIFWNSSHNSHKKLHRFSSSEVFHVSDQTAQQAQYRVPCVSMSTDLTVQTGVKSCLTPSSSGRSMR